jgi:long-chain acyl-CoA synthetase
MADLASRPAAADVRSLGGLALAAADRYSGDAMRAPGRPAITYADFGSFCAGATVVPVYHTNSPEECEYVLSHSGAKVVLVEDAEQAAKIASVRGALPELEHVIVLTGEAEGAITLADLRSRGDAAVAAERVAAIDPQDTATIVYTSGTTGPPKGCVLSHANLLFTAGTYIDRLNLRAKPPVIFQYLPLAHVLARMVSFVTLETGGTLAFWGGDAKRIAGELAEVRPTHFPSVPRVYEKIHGAILGEIGAAPDRASRTRSNPSFLRTDR